MEPLICILQYCVYCSLVLEQSTLLYKLIVYSMKYSILIILWLLKLGIIVLINNKDDIQFVTEFPCFWDTLYKEEYKTIIARPTNNT